MRHDICSRVIISIICCLVVLVTGCGEEKEPFTDVRTISSGGLHSAIKKDGTLWVRDGYFDKNGYFSITQNFSLRLVLIQVGVDSDWYTVDSGTSLVPYTQSQFMLALKNDGTLWSWGENSHGQLGNGTTVHASSPSKVGSDTDWAAISAGGDYALAIKTDGTLWAWGSNYLGKLGTGDEADSAVPIQVGSDTDWIAVSAGDWLSTALKNDGTLWEWGEAWVSGGPPEQVGSDKDWIAVETGYLYRFALKSDGTLWGWGYNLNGEISIDILEDRIDQPTQVGTDSWLVVRACDYSSVGIKEDGTIWRWGAGSSAGPVRIGTDSDWVDVSSCSYYLALKSDGTIWSQSDDFTGFTQINKK